MTAHRLTQRGGVWYCAVYRDGQRVRLTTRCRDRDAAEIVAAKMEREYAAGGPAALADLLRAYEVAITAERGTASGYFAQRKAHPIAEHFGTLRAADLDHARVMEYAEARRAAGRSDATIRSELMVLRGALRLASERGAWRGDPRKVTRFDRAPEAGMANVVYFVQSGEGGPIKIGWAADFAARLAVMQTGNPVELVVLATVPGSRAAERELHARFASLRIRREWFRPEAELLQYIVRLPLPAPAKRGAP
jgi:hypothetical protein